MQPFYFNYDKEAAKTSFAAYFATFAVVVFMLHSMFGTKVCCFFFADFCQKFCKRRGLSEVENRQLGDEFAPAEGRPGDC